MKNEPIMQITGRQGSRVYFFREGKFVSRELPAKMKLTEATQRCSGNFGLSARIGKIFRRLLEPAIPLPKDRRMQIRFSGSFAKWLGANNIEDVNPMAVIPVVSGFNFNSQCRLFEAWSINPWVEQQNPNVVKVHIPSFVPTGSMSVPPGTTNVKCTLIAAGCQPKNTMTTGFDKTTFTFSYSNEPVAPQVFSLTVAAPPGTIVLTVAALRFQLADGSFNESPDYLPASVIGAAYS